MFQDTYETFSQNFATYDTYIGTTNNRKGQDDNYNQREFVYCAWTYGYLPKGHNTWECALTNYDVNFDKLLNVNGKEVSLHISQLFIIGNGRLRAVEGLDTHNTHTHTHAHAHAHAHAHTHTYTYIHVRII